MAICTTEITEATVATETGIGGFVLLRFFVVKKGVVDGNVAKTLPRLRAGGARNSPATRPTPSRDVAT
jgi:hypothetical protein